jgi:hypothetical protein
VCQRGVERRDTGTNYDNNIIDTTLTEHMHNSADERFITRRCW